VVCFELENRTLDLANLKQVC